MRARMTRTPHATASIRHVSIVSSTFDGIGTDTDCATKSSAAALSPTCAPDAAVSEPQPGPVCCGQRSHCSALAPRLAKHLGRRKQAHVRILAFLLGLPSDIDVGPGKHRPC